MNRLFSLAVSLSLLVLVGCASSPDPGSGGAPRRESNRITSEEIRQVQAQSTYDLIRSLRPAWLERRGQHSLTNPAAGQVVVYVDGTRTGGPDFLRQIPAINVESAQYLSGTEAGSRFGLDHSGGAILVTTRRR